MVTISLPECFHINFLRSHTSYNGMTTDSLFALITSLKANFNYSLIHSLLKAQTN